MPYIFVSSALYLIFYCTICCEDKLPRTQNLRDEPHVNMGCGSAALFPRRNLLLSLRAQIYSARSCFESLAGVRLVAHGACEQHKRRRCAGMLDGVGDSEVKFFH